MLLPEGRMGKSWKPLERLEVREHWIEKYILTFFFMLQRVMLYAHCLCCQRYRRWSCKWIGLDDHKAYNIRVTILDIYIPSQHGLNSEVIWIAMLSVLEVADLNISLATDCCRLLSLRFCFSFGTRAQSGPWPLHSSPSKYLYPLQTFFSSCIVSCVCNPSIWKYYEINQEWMNS